MADVIISRKDIQSIIDGVQLSHHYVNYIDVAFMPIPLAIDAIEKGKKGTMMPLNLKKLINCLPVYVNVIPLSTRGLSDALCDSEFSEKYINRAGNPFEFVTEACLYEYEGWWEMTEMMESFMELSWK